jgi:hypothetical protein
MVLAVGAVAFALSFGPAFAPYRWLYRVFPLLTGIRGAVRFGQIALAATGILAGFGAAALAQRIRHAAPFVCIVLIVAVNGEALRAPIAYAEYAGIPPVYDALTKIGRRAVLVGVPFYGSAQFHLNAPLMLASTRSWQPMLNGYSGFKPASYYEHARILAEFPDRDSVRYLREAGVSYVLVDGEHMRPDRLARLTEFPELKLWVTDGKVRIYFLSS